MQTPSLVDYKSALTKFGGKVMTNDWKLVVGWLLSVLGAILLLWGVIGLVYYFTGTPSIVYQMIF